MSDEERENDGHSAAGAWTNPNKAFLAGHVLVAGYQ